MKNIDLNNKNLAINGGNPVRILPWLDNFTTGEEEKKAVIRVMDKGYLSLFEGSHTPDAPFAFEGGPEVIKLESAWCKYYNSNFAVSMNSATSCLYAAIGALGIGYGDEVIVSPYTMTACATAPLIYGAIPVFADVELETGSISKDDEIEYIKKESDSMSVYEIAEILFKDVNNIDKMKKAVDLKYLTEEIKERFRERLMKLGDYSSL